MNNIEVLNAIKESLEDYVCPILIIGNIDFLEIYEYASILPATCNSEDLLVRNGRYPNWLYPIMYNSATEDDLLIITDFDELSTEEQKRFIDLICYNSISSEKLPDSLKIVINAKKKFSLIRKISENVQTYTF